MKNLEINGYKIFEIADDAIYIAKSKEDLFNFYENSYGPIKEICCMTNEEFLSELVELPLESEKVQKEITLAEETETGTEMTNTTMYALYVKEAEKDQGCLPILWFDA